MCKCVGGSKNSSFATVDSRVLYPCGDLFYCELNEKLTKSKVFFCFFLYLKYAYNIKHSVLLRVSHISTKISHFCRVPVFIYHLIEISILTQFLEISIDWQNKT